MLSRSAESLTSSAIGSQEIYKIVERSEWDRALTAGEFTGSAIDRQDGYIHFSAAEQVAETLAKHFAGQADLLLIRVDAGRLGDSLRWEISRGGALFPHLYAALPISAVVGQTELPLLANGGHQLPPEFPA